MTWLETISSSIGVGTGGATLALAIYAGSGALEADVRPEARKQIAQFLKRPPIDQASLHAAELVAHLFDITFGERQWSLRCFRRSCLSSMVFVFSVLLVFYLKHRPDMVWPHDPDGRPYAMAAVLIANILPFLLFSILPDYVSLAKARWILRRMARSRTLIAVILLIALDVVLSYAVSMMFYYGIVLPIRGVGELCATYRHYEGPVACGNPDNPLEFLSMVVTISGDMVWFATHAASEFPLGNVIAFAFGVSTVLTSVWTVLVMVAIALLRLAVGLNLAFGVARWLFDVDRHPIKTLGRFIAALVWLGSVGYGLV